MAWQCLVKDCFEASAPLTYCATHAAQARQDAERAEDRAQHRVAMENARKRAQGAIAEPGD